MIANYQKCLWSFKIEELGSSNTFRFVKDHVPDRKSNEDNQVVIFAIYLNLSIIVQNDFFLMDFALIPET